MLSAKQGGIKCHFWVFGMTRPGIKPWFPGPLANTLLIRPMVSSLLIPQAFTHSWATLVGQVYSNILPSRLISLKWRCSIGFDCYWLLNNHLEFFQAVIMSVLLYNCTIWTLMKHLERKLGVNYHVVFNNAWNRHPTKQQLYIHLPPISFAIKVRQAGHSEPCWWSKHKLMNDIFLWTPIHGHTNVG